MSVGNSRCRATARTLLSPSPHDGFRLGGGLHAASWADPHCGGGQNGTPCRRPPPSLPPRHPRRAHPNSHHSASVFFLPPPSPPTNVAAPTAAPRPRLSKTVCGVAAPLPRRARPPLRRPGSPPCARRRHSLPRCRPVSSSARLQRIAGGHSSPVPPRPPRPRFYEAGPPLAPGTVGPWLAAAGATSAAVPVLRRPVSPSPFSSPSPRRPSLWRAPAEVATWMVTPYRRRGVTSPGLHGGWRR